MDACDRKDTVELRFEAPREYVQTLDAESLSRNLTRGQVMNELVADLHRRRRRFHMVLTRLTRGNPVDSGIDGDDAA